MSNPLPGSAEWLRYMTASKVSAVMGTSPFESRFSLWHRMHGDIGPQPQSDEMTYGSVMESAILAWFAAERFPEGGTRLRETWITHPDSPLFACSPDGLAFEESATVPIEVKTGRQSWEWGPSESDGPIPPGYYDQVQWQMYVMSAPYAYVAADVMMSLRWYRIERDDERIRQIVDACTAFMDSITAGDAPPIDGSTHTYLAIRELHPDIDGSTIELDPILARQWLVSKTDLKAATVTEQALRSQLLDYMGVAQHGTFAGQTIASRQARGTGTPYLVAAKNLPTLEGLAA